MASVLNLDCSLTLGTILMGFLWIKLKGVKIRFWSVSITKFWFPFPHWKKKNFSESCIHGHGKSQFNVRKLKWRQLELSWCSQNVQFKFCMQPTVVQVMVCKKNQIVKFVKNVLIFQTYLSLMNRKKILFSEFLQFSHQN